VPPGYAQISAERSLHKSFREQTAAPEQENFRLNTQNKSSTISFLAAGDCGPCHGPKDGFPIERYSELIRPTLAAADLRFTNCEHQYSDRKGRFPQLLLSHSAKWRGRSQQSGVAPLRVKTYCETRGPHAPTRGRVRRTACLQRRYCRRTVWNPYRLCPSFSTPSIGFQAFAPDDPRFEEIVRYMGWTSEGFEHKFKVTGSEVCVTAG